MKKRKKKNIKNYTNLAKKGHCAVEQRTDEANIVTNPVATTQSVPLGMKRKLMLRLSDAIPLTGVISNRKKTISNIQKEVEKEYALKQVIFKCTINLPKTQDCKVVPVKFMFSMKATKFDKIFTVDVMLCSKCQMDGEDFVNFCGLLRKHEL